MASPWKHPATGVFYLRRQIPERLRAAFDGKALFKASLGTKSSSEATVLFLQANAALEQRFEEARLRLKATGSPCPTDRDRADDLVGAYFEGPERTPGGLDGVERLQLARIEVDRGLWDATPGGCSRGGPLAGQTWWEIANNAALYRDHPCRQPVNDHPAGSIWRWEDESFRPGAREAQVGRVIDQIARHSDINVADVPAGLADAVRAYLDRAPVEATKLRKRRHTAGRARADMRVEELFESWRDAMQPSLQTAHEYAGAARDFVDCVGDIPVEEIVHGDLLDYRDEAALLPKTMPKAHRLLPFSERLALHRDTDAPRVSGATLKKRIGAVQALLSFARAQKWISRNEGRDVPIIGYVKNSMLKRRTFQEDDLQLLLADRLFTRPSTWKHGRSVSDMTLYWLFLLGITTGARLEEVGQAMVRDVKRDGAVTYIDIDDYVEAQTEDGAKSLKTATSRRLVPVHIRLLELGFLEYVEALRLEGHERVFPDLTANQFGKRTKEASRIANRLIDRIVSKDSRLVFHSFRHGFKDLALEAGVVERIVDQICGHAPTTVGGKYGQGVRLAVLNRELHRIDWSFINWQILCDASAGMRWSQKIVALIPKGSDQTFLLIR